MSHKVLTHTNFISGPDFVPGNEYVSDEVSGNLMTFTLPNHSHNKGFVYSGLVSNESADPMEKEILICTDRFSSFQRLARVLGNVLLF